MGETVRVGSFVVFFLGGTVEEEEARLRVERGVGGGGGGCGVMGSRLSPDCTMRFIHFSKAVLTKFSSSSSSSTAMPP